MLNHNTIILSVSMIFLSTPIFAKQTSAFQAMDIAQKWTAKQNLKTDIKVTKDSTNIESFYDNSRLMYHIVPTKPSGYIVVSGDDRVEPIVSFIHEGIYDSEEKSYLNDMLQNSFIPRMQKIIKTSTKLGSRSSSINPKTGTKEKNRWTKKVDKTTKMQNARAFKFDLKVPASDARRSSSIDGKKRFKATMREQSIVKETLQTQRGYELSDYDLLVISYDKNGDEISRRTMLDPTISRLEVFDEHTGEIVESNTEYQEASLEIVLADDENLHFIEIFKPVWNGDKFILESRGASNVTAN